MGELNDNHVRKNRGSYGRKKEKIHRRFHRLFDEWNIWKLFVNDQFEIVGNRLI